MAEFGYIADSICDREDTEGKARKIMREMINETRDGLEIDLQKLLRTYFSKWWLIVASVLAAALIAFFVTANVITPMYQARVTIYVNNTAAGQQVDYISNANLATSQRLVNTYVNIIQSDTVLEKVAVVSGIEITANQIRHTMSAEQVDDTEMFHVVITHSDPEMAARMANAIAEVAPAEIGRFVEGSSTKVVDYAKVPTDPSSPNLKKNCVLGGMLGAVIALAYLTLTFLLDVRIKDEEDLNTLFDIPVLAQIPGFMTEQSKRSDYGRQSYEADEEKKGGRAQ